MRALIIANGQLGDAASVSHALRKDDLLIAADGGGQHFLDLNLVPDLIVGDMDSLSPEAVEQLEAKGARVVRHARRKDETDLELAVAEAINAGVDDILIFGALGKRWDMTLANVLLPADRAFRNTCISLIDGNQRVTLLQPGKTHHIEGTRGDTLSLIPLAGDATGITTEHLDFPLRQETLHFGSPRGVSNVFLADHASVRFETGLLLCIHIEAAGSTSDPAAAL